MSELLKKYGVQPAASTATKQNGGDRVVEAAKDDSRQPQAATDLLAKYGVAKPAEQEKPGRGPKGGPVKSAWELPGRFWDDLTTPPENSSAKAMMQTMDSAGGYVRSGLADVAKRIATLGQNGFDLKKAAAYGGNPIAALLAGGGEGLSTEDWKATRSGNAPSLRKHLADAGAERAGLSRLPPGKAGGDRLGPRPRIGAIDLCRRARRLCLERRADGLCPAPQPLAPAAPAIQHHTPGGVG